MSPEDRFWQRVEKTDTCWLWTGPINPNGYGAFWWQGRSGYGHRFSYTAFVGEIPPGLQIDHLCRVRHCVNPDHLEAVTPRENLIRGETSIRRNLSVTHCPKGHQYAGANLRMEGSKRHCRSCDREQMRDYRLRRAA